MKSWLDRLHRERVIVHTKDDQSIRGLIGEAYRDCVVLAEAEYLLKDVEAPSEKKTVELDGRPVIPRENIAWVQKLSEE